MQISREFSQGIFWNRGHKQGWDFKVKAPEKERDKPTQTWFPTTANCKCSMEQIRPAGPSQAEALWGDCRQPGKKTLPLAVSHGVRN